MTKLIDVYRLVNGVETVVYRISKEKATLYQTIMDKDKVTIEVVTEDPISLQEGDYVLVDGIKYKINRDPEEKQSSEKKHSYTSSFEAPIYTLIDKLFCSKITGYTTFTLTGKLRDFLELLIWNVNYDATDNPKGVDTGWSIGLCPDTDYMNITFAGVTCRDALNTFASKFGVEYYAENKTLNFVSHIEKETGLIFTQGKGEGLYEVDKKNVDDGDLVTRVYAKGGTENVIPGEGDYDGRLILPEGYIENFSDSNRVVEAVVEFDDIHPTFEGTVGVVSGDNNREFICAAIDFDLADVAVSDEARVNFLTGDLMGKSFEFKWNNSLKKITLIYQEDELAAIDTTTGVRPNIPSTSKYLRGGELFNFTGIKLSGTYKTNAITKLRSKATEWLSYYCRKRVKFELNVDYRYLREKNITLHCGDLITINVPLHNISKLIRITSIERNLYTGKLTCVVSNYLDEKWKDKIETEVANIKSSTTTVNGGYGASSVSILETIDEREASDSNVLSSLRALKEIAERALSRTSADTAAGLITFAKGLISKESSVFDKDLTVGETLTASEIKNSTHTSGQFGSGYRISINPKTGDSEAEVDHLLVRKEAIFNKLSIAEIKSVGGAMLLSCASMTCLKVKELDDVYRCFYDTDEGTITNQFAVEDQAICRRWNGQGMKYYWRLVTAIGTDYIDLSKTDVDGLGVPTAQDEIIQLGNRTDKSRQSALYKTAYGINAPAEYQYDGIDSYDLTGKEAIVISPSGNKFTGEFHVKTGDTSVRIPADKGEWGAGAYSYYDRVSHNGSLWLALVNTSEEPCDSSADWLKQVSEGGSGYRVEKLATPGYEFYREHQIYSHTLAVRVYLNEEDITETLNMQRFKWTRVSENTDGDPTWNELHANSGYKIDITGSDLAGDTFFILQFYDVTNNRILTTKF